MLEEQFDYEDMAALRGQVERRAAVLPLDVHLGGDSYSLVQLGWQYGCFL